MCDADPAVRAPPMATLPAAASGYDHWTGHVAARHRFPL